jgi:ABC-2 type transport system permease protein
VKKIISIVYKDIRIRFSSPVEWLFFFILPVVFILILSGGTGPPQDQRITLQVVDQAESELSARLFSELEKSTSIRPSLTPLQEALDDFESRQVSAVLVIPQEFTLSTLQDGRAQVELMQQQNNLNALIDQQAVELAVARISSLVDIANTSVEVAANISPFNSENERRLYFNAGLALAEQFMVDSPDWVVGVDGNTVDTINYNPRANSTFGQLITWVFIPLIGLSAMFAGEREWGTLRRLLITPTSKALYIGATVFGQVLTAVFQMTILVTFGLLALNLDLGQSLPALFLIIICSALAAAAMGTMLGTFVKTEGQANGLSIMIGMVMAMMGGCWYPIELFPATIQNIVKILPTTWAMQGFLDVAVRGQRVQGILLECLVLMGFTILFFAIGVWRFKYE